MSGKTWNDGNLLRYFVLGVTAAAFAALIGAGWHPAAARLRP
jgi:hypothetical protein